MQYGADDLFKPLRSVALCKPHYFDVITPICSYQKPWVGKIDKAKAKQQHKDLEKVLVNEGVSVHDLQLIPGKTDQTFSRDIGYISSNGALLSSPKERIRQGEELSLLRLCYIEGIPIQNKHLPLPFEGGDVFPITPGEIVLGYGNRTHQFTVRQVGFRAISNLHLIRHRSTHHLDAVFNILEEDCVAAHRKLVDLNNSYFSGKKVLDLDDQDIEEMGANFVLLKRGRVLADANCKFNEVLRKEGYDVVEVDVSELKKGGGSVRCLTLELYRG